MNELLKPFGTAGAGDLTEAARRARQPMLQPGLSIGAGTAGTAGLLLQDARGQPYMLTCFHVLLYMEANRPITQPAPGLDGGRFGPDTIAYSYLFQHPRFGDQADAALAWVDVRLRHLLPTQAGTNHIVQGIAQPQIGKRVVKSGRTTGVTSGIIEQFGVFPVTYDFGLGTFGIRGFRIVPDDPASTKPIASRGDSGAVWYDPDTLQAVGLLVSGRDTPPYEAIACPLPDLLNRFNLPLRPLLFPL